LEWCSFGLKFPAFIRLTNTQFADIITENWETEIMIAEEWAAKRKKAAEEKKAAEKKVAEEKAMEEKTVATPAQERSLPADQE